ncbi:DsbA family protein [soil metagenome]
MQKYIYIVTVALVVVVVVVFSGNQTETNNSDITVNTSPISASQETDGISEVLETDLIIGDVDAPATIIEYGDYKCSACNQFSRTTEKELAEAYINDGQLKIVYRPIAVIGPDSERSAVGAYCADEQGEFPAYHSAVFDYVWADYYQLGNYAYAEDILTTDVLGNIATDLGMSRTVFADCLESAVATDTVERNLQIASQDGVRGTPTFKVSGQTVVGPQPFNVFKPLVDIQL